MPTAQGKGRGRASTNPFDSSDESENENRMVSQPAQANGPKRKAAQAANGPQRKAPLYFNSSCDPSSQPALRFERDSPRDAIFSPLQNALDQVLTGPTDEVNFGFDSELDSSLDSNEEGLQLFQNNEETPLLSGSLISDKYNAKQCHRSDRESPGRASIKRSSLNSSSKKRQFAHRERPSFASQGEVVLRRLSNLSWDELQGSREFKMIRLEDVGTAKSWLILLLPYLAFAVCLLLEANTSLRISHVGPFSAAISCYDSNSSAQFAVPIEPTPAESCNYNFYLSNEQATTLMIYKEIIEHVPPKRENQDRQYCLEGTAFESGVLSSIPQFTSFLYANAAFPGLSLFSIAAIQQGRIGVAGLLYQNEYDNIWSLVATSRVEKLSVSCLEKRSASSGENEWICSAPKVMEILFSMPGSAILSGNQFRVNILFSYLTDDEVGPDQNPVYVCGPEDLSSNLGVLDHSGTDGAAVREIVQASQFSIQFTNPTAVTFDICGRVVALTITIAFTFMFLRRVGFQCSGLCSCKLGSDDGTFKIRQALTLVDSPWVLFPERWYIVLLLFFLMLIQGPCVIVQAIFPELHSNIRFKTASDTLVGVGLNGVFFVYLCLFEGLQYHTARVARRWMFHHRKLSKIRRVAKQAVGDDKEAIVQYTADYFDKHGDVDGVVSLIHIRLNHDPFGHLWADFLVPKFVLFCSGTISIWLTAFTRAHFTSTETNIVPTDLLQVANTIYCISYVAQFTILFTWLLMILRASLITGNKLRLQPFLSTRPAQLSYRVLFTHMTLGSLSIAAEIAIGLGHSIEGWGGGVQSLQPTTNDPLSVDTLDFWLQLLTRILQRFPYSGTAADVGLGRITFATVTILIAAFIFLPPKHMDGSDDEGVEEELASQRIRNQGNETEKAQLRDKRLVVSMMKYAHTWRVFPLPIERASAVKRLMISDKFFQLGDDGSRDYDNKRDPGIVSIGPYMPVFCVELACWLHEASFQAYYSPTAVNWNDWTPGKMNLSSIGLKLEAAVLDKSTNTQAFIATNTADQADGAEDGIVVIAFRGSVDASNLKTDLKSGLVALPDQLIGVENAPFKVSEKQVTVESSNGWVWNTQLSESHTVSCFSSQDDSLETESTPLGSVKKLGAVNAVSSGALAVLSATPVARSTFPCVHQGFCEVYSALRQRIIERILPVLQRQLSKALLRSRNARKLGDDSGALMLPKVYITGHSLGGSLGQLLALDLAGNCELVINVTTRPLDLQDRQPEEDLFQIPKPASSSESNSRDMATEMGRREVPKKMFLQPPIAFYSFGQPRVGNRAFSKLYKQRVPHSFRVATEGDPITALPQVALSGIYKHAGLEVVLDEGRTGNILVGPTVVETLFRFHQVRTDFKAHSTDRYRDCLESALEPHELEQYYKGHSYKNPEEYGGGGLAQTSQNVPEWMTQGRSTNNLRF